MENTDLLNDSIGSEFIAEDEKTVYEKVLCKDQSFCSGGKINLKQDLPMKISNIRNVPSYSNISFNSTLTFTQTTDTQSKKQSQTTFVATNTTNLTDSFVKTQEEQVSSYLIF
jgi:hypothetical protein